MKEERDKFLTEAIGECWHWADENILDSTRKWIICHTCNDCGKAWTCRNDFSTWEGFGKLWEWTQQQSWKDDLLVKILCESQNWVKELIHPDRFADAVYNYLKGTNA